MSTLMPTSIDTPQFPGPRPTWLWPLRIPLAKITLLAGDPGLGKSFLALDLAARLSTGSPMPHQPPIPIENRNSKIENDPPSQLPMTNYQLIPSSTLLLSAEDELHDTIRPRLQAQNADLERIIPLRCLDASEERPEPFSLKNDLDELKMAIECNDNVQLIILDPITAFMDGIDHNSTAHIRQHLTPLAHLAAFYNVAILAITHLSKETRKSSLHRAVGSLALAAIARTVHLIHPHPARTHNLLTPIKQNLSTPQPPLPFRITNNKLEWIPPELCSHRPTGGAPPAPQDSNTPDAAADFYEHHDRQLAIDYLLDALKDGPQPAIPLIRQARQLAITERTLKRAKAYLGIESKKSGRYEWQWLMTER